MALGYFEQNLSVSFPKYERDGWFSSVSSNKLRVRWGAERGAQVTEDNRTCACVSLFSRATENEDFTPAVTWESEINTSLLQPLQQLAHASCTNKCNRDCAIKILHLQQKYLGA